MAFWNFGILIPAGILTLTLFFGVFWLIIRKARYSHRFRYFSRDMKTTYIVKARITTDTNNKKSKVYSFRDTDSQLTLREPHGYEEGKPIRYITMNEMGEYVYITPKDIDKNNLLSSKIEPVERQLYLHQLKDNQEKYKIVDKYTIIAFAGFIVMGIILLVGFIYVFGTMAKFNNAATENVEATKVISETTKQTVIALEPVINNLAHIYSYITNTSVVRPLT